MIWIIFGQISSVIGSLILLRIITDNLDPSEYGEISLVLTSSGFVNQVLMGGVIIGVGRFYPIAVEKSNLICYVSSVMRIMAFSSLVVISIGIIVAIFLFLNIDSKNWIWLIVFTHIFSISASYVSIFSSIQSAARKRSMVAFISGLDAILKVVIIVFIIKYVSGSSTGVLFGYTITSIFVAALQMYFLKKNILNQFQDIHQLLQIDWERKIWSFAWPFSIFGIFTWLQQSSDRWALNTFTSPSELGQYMAVFQIGFTPIGLLTGFFVSLINPILFERTSSNFNESSNLKVRIFLFRVVLTCFVLTVVSVIFTFLFHSWIFSFFVGDQYQSKSYLLPWVVCSGGLFAAGQIISLNHMNELKTKKLIAPKIITALIGVFCNIFGAKFYGVEGVVFSLVFFSMIYFFWLAIAVYRQTLKELY